MTQPMTKEKTAMAELRDELLEYQNDGHDMVPIRMVVAFATQRIPKERQQIEAAVAFGNMQEFYDGTEKLAQDYYASKFGE